MSLNPHGRDISRGTCARSVQRTSAQARSRNRSASKTSRCNRYNKPPINESAIRQAGALFFRQKDAGSRLKATSRRLEIGIAEFSGRPKTPEGAAPQLLIRNPQRGWLPDREPLVRMACLEAAPRVASATY